MNQREHNVQVALIAWFRLQYPALAKHLFAIPNGGARHPVTAAKLKAEGVLPGVADLFLIKSSNGYPGLFLELKADKGRVSDHQSAFLERAAAEGYCTRVAFGLDEAIAAIKEYLA